MSALRAGAPPVATPATTSERWRRLPRRWRALIIALTAVVVVEFALSLVGNLYSSPSTSPIGSASSESPAGDGTQALAVLLSDRHHAVRQVAVPLTQSTLPLNGTVFVLDPAGSIKDEVPALTSYVRAGGRLVLSGQPNEVLLASLLGTSGLPVWSPIPAGTSHPVATAPEVAGVATVTSPLSGSWSGSSTQSAGSTTSVLLQGQQGSLALLAQVGRGTLVLLASSGPLQNEYLATADNAAFALNLAGNPTSPAVFDEWDHGLGRSGTGLAGLPAHWQMGLALMLAAALVWVLSAARRFGPPQHAEREFIPPRVAHVDAVAALLAAGDPEHRAAGAEPLRHEGRRLIARLVRAAPDTSDESLVQLAAQGDIASVTAEQAAALLGTPRSAEDLVKLGTAFTSLERDHGA